MPDDDVVRIGERFPGAVPVDDDEEDEVEIEVPTEGVRLEDFYAYMPQHKYMFEPTRELWPVASVNNRLPPVPLANANGMPVLDAQGKIVKLKPSVWLDRNSAIEQITWAPGLPLIIEDRLIDEGGWIKRKGVKVFNLYRSPTLPHGDPDKADPWLDHIAKIYPDDDVHIVQWLAQRVQHPEIKINHALVLGGGQGIGKDMLVEPVKRAVGTWNFGDISPKDLTKDHNDFARSVILRISEAHDLGDLDRYSFYDKLKTYATAPPDEIRVNEKYIRQYYIPNCCGVIITTNHQTDGLYLPEDDRRTYVTWSSAKRADFLEGYWKWMWDWYDDGGAGHVAAFLAQLDIRGFNPKAPPPQTPAFWHIVNSGRSPENGELADILELLKEPDVVTLRILIATAEVNNRQTFAEWLADRRNRKAASYRLEDCGYAPVRNPDDVRDGQWQIFGHRQTVYAKVSLSLAEQIVAARGVDGAERARAATAT